MIRQADSPAVGAVLHSGKNKSCARIGLINVNGLGNKRWEINQKRRMKISKLNKIDILGITEPHLNLMHVDPKDQWEERCKGGWENSHTSKAYNIHDVSDSQFQPDGCLQLTTNNPVFRVIGSGADNTGLG